MFHADTESWHISLCAIALIAGCEASPADPADASPADAAAQDVTETDASIEDASTEEMWQGPCQGLEGHYEIRLHAEAGYPDNTWSLTLDLHDTGTTCEALITPKWYPSVKLTAQVTSAAVTLDDSVGPPFPIVAMGTSNDPHSFIELHFKQIELPRKQDGKLSGVASASADFCHCSDDFIYPGLRQQTGIVVTTFGPAELYAGPPRFRPLPRPGSGNWCGYLARGGPRRLALTPDLLPWDTLAVETSKPVSELSTKVSSTSTAAWIDAPLDDVATAANVWAWTHFLDWDQVRGTEQEVLFEGPPQWTTTVSVLDVGAALAEHDLTTGFTGASFGKVVLSPDGATITNACSGGIGGIAGRLQTSGKSAVLVRLRLNHSVQPLVRIAGSSGRQYELESSSLPDDGTWTDVKVPIEDETEVGFSIAPYGTCFMLSSKPAVVDVIRVWAE